MLKGCSCRTKKEMEDIIGRWLPWVIAVLTDTAAKPTGSDFVELPVKTSSWLAVRSYKNSLCFYRFLKQSKWCASLVLASSLRWPQPWLGVLSLQDDYLSFEVYLHAASSLCVVNGDCSWLCSSGPWVLSWLHLTPAMCGRRVVFPSSLLQPSAPKLKWNRCIINMYVNTRIQSWLFQWITRSQGSTIQ